MLFIDAHFTDGALVSGYMSAVEAKVKALHDLHIEDSVIDCDWYINRYPASWPYSAREKNI